jgi:hypothetical protein
MKLLYRILTIGFIACTMAARAEGIETNKPIDIVVYRSPSCECCGKWLEHLKNNNFNVKDILTEDVQAVKQKYGISAAVSSCQTAIVDGYIVEGHVPANDIINLLKTRPKIVGISVPGMPMGTPGMEMGGKKDAYKVMSFDKENDYKVFNSYQ